METDTKNNFFSNIHPFSQLILFISISFGLFIAFFGLGFLISVPVFGLNLNDVKNMQGENINLNFLKFMQVVQSFGLFIIPSLITAFLLGNRSIPAYLQFKKQFNPNSVMLVITIMFILLPFINFLSDFNMSLKLPPMFHEMETWMKNSEKSAADLTEKFLKVNTYPALFFNLFLMAVLPAIGEEFFFRGVLQRIFTNWTKNAHAAIIITAAIFSAIHFQFYGFLPRMVLGMVFGYFLLWSKNIWLPVLAHFLNNGIAVIAYFYVNRGHLDMEIENVGATSETTFMAFICFIFFSGLMILFYNQENKSPNDKNRIF